MNRRARELAAVAPHASPAPADPGRSAPLVQNARAATGSAPNGAAKPVPPVAIAPNTAPLAGDTGPAQASAAHPVPGPLPAPASVERMRAEVRADPHTTPPSVLAFAAGWGTRMQAAQADAALAALLVAQADRWVGDNATVAPVFQAIALNNVALLASVHPQLESRYRAMRHRADARVIELAE